MYLQRGDFIYIRDSLQITFTLFAFKKLFDKCVIPTKMCIGKIRSAPLDEVPFKPSTFSQKNEKLVTNEPKNVLFNESGKIHLQEDALAVSTHYTKLILFGIGDLLKRFQNSVCYRYEVNLKFY